MADSRDSLPVTLEVVLVALAPQLSLNSTGNATTTAPYALEALGNKSSYGQSVDGSFSAGAAFPDGSDGQAARNGAQGPLGDLEQHSNMVSVTYISLFSTLFCIVGLVGMTGNALVVYIVLKDKKMRKSVTNLLILNLAVADSLLMVFGVPEIVQFMLDRGWLLGSLPCRLDRFLLVVCLYSSVLSLVSVCFER